MKDLMLDTVAAVVYVSKLLYVISEQSFADTIKTWKPTLNLPNRLLSWRLRGFVSTGYVQNQAVTIDR